MGSVVASVGNGIGMFGGGIVAGRYGGRRVVAFGIIGGMAVVSVDEDVVSFAAVVVVVVVVDAPFVATDDIVAPARCGGGCEKTVVTGAGIL